MDQLIKLIDKKLEFINNVISILSTRVKNNYEKIRFFNNCRSNLDLVDVSLIDDMFELNNSNSRDFDFIKFIMSENLYKKYNDQSQVKNAIEMFSTAASEKIVELEESNSKLNKEKQELFRESTELVNNKNKLINCFSNKTFFDKEMVDFITDIVSFSDSYNKDLFNELISILNINTSNLKSDRKVEEKKDEVISKIEDSLKEVVDESKDEEAINNNSSKDLPNYSKVWDKLKGEYERVIGGNYGVLFVYKDELYGVCSAKTGDVIIPCKFSEYSDAWNYWKELEFPTEKIQNYEDKDLETELAGELNEVTGYYVDSTRIDNLLKNTEISRILLQLHRINKSLDLENDNSEVMKLLKEKLELQIKLQELFAKEEKQDIQENMIADEEKLEEKQLNEDILDPVYQDLKTKFDLVVKTDDDVYFVSKNNSYGVYSLSGEQIMPCQYNEYSEAYHYWSNLGFPKNPIEEEIELPIEDAKKELKADEYVSNSSNNIEKTHSISNVRRTHHGGVTTEIKNDKIPKTYVNYSSKKETKKDFYNPSDEKSMIKTLPNLTNDQIDIVENINDPKTLDVIRDSIDKYMKVNKPKVILAQDYITKFVKVCLFNECSKSNLVDREALFADMKRLKDDVIDAVTALYQIYGMYNNSNTKEKATKMLQKFFYKHKTVFEKYDYEVSEKIIPRRDYRVENKKPSVGDITDIFQPIFEEKIDDVQKPITNEVIKPSVSTTSEEIAMTFTSNNVSEDFERNYNEEVEELRLIKSLMSDDLSVIHDYYENWLEKVANSKDIYKNDEELFNKIINKKNYFADIEKLLKGFSKNRLNDNENISSFYPLVYAHGLKLTLNYDPSKVQYNFNTLLYFDRIILHQFGDESKNENYINYLEEYAKANNDNVFLEVVNYMKSINKDDLVNLSKYNDLKAIQDDIIILIVSDQMSFVRARHIMRMIQQFKDTYEQAKSANVSR